jgi:hypothetical protein
MPIYIKSPIPHPTQLGVFFTEYALEGLELVNGSSIDAPAELTVTLRPCVPFTVNGVTAYLSAPNVQMLTMSIPDVYQWVAQRVNAGDFLPAQVMGGLVQAAGEEYARR